MSQVNKVLYSSIETALKVLSTVPEILVAPNSTDIIIRLPLLSKNMIANRIRVVSEEKGNTLKRTKVIREHVYQVVGGFDTEIVSTTEAETPFEVAAEVVRLVTRVQILEAFNAQ